jgi:hypothetical protein
MLADVAQKFEEADGRVEGVVEQRAGLPCRNRAGGGAVPSPWRCCCPGPPW